MRVQLLINVSLHMLKGFVLKRSYLDLISAVVLYVLGLESVHEFHEKFHLDVMWFCVSVMISYNLFMPISRYDCLLAGDCYC